MTRAFAHLAKGEWSAAVHDHPLAPLLAAELAALWIAWGCRVAGLWAVPPWLRRLRWRRWSPPELLVLGEVALFFVVWLGRLATGTLP